jgi:hypothetical protein
MGTSVYGNIVRLLSWSLKGKKGDLRACLGMLADTVFCPVECGHASEGPWSK